MTYDEFESLFEPLPPGYYDQTRLIDKYVGFSVQRNYPENTKFRPAITQEGLPDTVALIHVLVDPDLPSAENSLPIRVRVSKFSRYLANHFDYDDQDPSSPNEETVRLSKAGLQPIDGMIVGQFFVNPVTREMLDLAGNRVTGGELLDHAFDQHVRTTKPLHPEQLKLKLGEVQGLLLSWIAIAARFLLTVPLGRELLPDKEMKYLFYGYRREDVRKLSVESLTIFDYLVPKPVAILFCWIVVASFLCFHVSGRSSAYLKSISDSGVLSATHGVVALWIINDLVPEILRLILNYGIVKGGRLKNFRIDKFL